jgi:perosamine synthetase
MIPIYDPFINERMKKYVMDCLETGWISSNGPYIERATEKLLNYTGSKYCVLTNNGTSATHLVARSLQRFKPAVSKIAVPSACYVAAWNSFLFDNFSWKLTLKDLDLKSWNADYEGLEDSPSLALLIVHNLGNIVNVPFLKRKYPNCVFVEDNCEGLFGKYEDKHSGTQSLCSSLSFFANKNLTTGEGGAFLTNDKDIYDFAYKLRGQGQTNKRYIHDELGYNYRMTNIQAAMLLAQLEDADEVKKKKQKVFDCYKYHLEGIEGISWQHVDKNAEHSNWMFGIRIEDLSNYDDAKRIYNRNNIDVRPMFYPYDQHRHLPPLEGETSKARILNRECVMLPSYPNLSEEEIEKICNVTKDINNGKIF